MAPSILRVFRSENQKLAGMNIQIRITMLIITFVVPTTSVADEETEADKGTRRVIRAIDLWRHDEAITKLFKTLSTDQIRDLKEHEHDTIAIAAAWHEVRETFAEATKPDTLPQHGAKIDRAALERFLGFVEGRLRIRVPKVWQESFRHTRVFSPRSIHIPTFTYWPRHSTDAGFSAPLSVHASKEDDRITVYTDTGERELPKSVHSTKGTLDGSLAAAIDNEYCVCAFYDEIGYGYKLHCISLKDGSVVWTKPVFAAFYGSTTGSGYQSRVSIRLKAGRAFVFGTCLMGSYVEVFSLKTGQPHCRFTSATQL